MATTREGRTGGESQVRFEASRIDALLAQAGDNRALLRQAGEAAGLGGEELRVLDGGQALVLTTAQYQALRSALAALYAQRPRGGSGEARTEDATGSTCGCSGSPTPTPQTVAPVTTTTGPNETSETAAGTELHSGTVGGATVSLRRGVSYQWDRGAQTWTNGFSVRYTGGDSQNAHWLQFIWREIVSIDARGTANPLTDSIRTTGGQYQLTPGGTATTFGTPGEANFNTDSASSSTPFYEGGGTNVRSSDSTTIYDSPGSVTTFAQREFDNGAQRVVSRAHFHTFLVQTDRVTYKMEINNEWVFNARADNPAPTTTAGTCGAAANLSPDALRAKFHSQWPAYTFIR